MNNKNKIKIENVKIFTMEDNVIIDSGYVCIEGNKITEINNCGGDGSGGWLFPGFIDAHTHMGLIEDGLSFEGDDINETSDPVVPHLRAVDAINPMDNTFKEARENGVTCVAVGPGSANPIGGQICIMKTNGKRIDKMLLKEPAAMKFSLGENPKNVYHGKNQSPETRMATAALIRENLYKARKYSEMLDKAKDSNNDNDGEEIDEPDFDMKLQALIPVIKGEIPVHFHAHRADDIFTAIRIANEFNLKYILIHCTEGHLISDELKEEKVRAIVGPNLCDRSKPELKSLTFENPNILDEAGIKIAVTTDHPVIPANYLSLCAALAVKSGMKMYNACKAITINAAEILGIENITGSLKIGKDADMVLFDGNPLDLQTKVKQVWINGTEIIT